MLNDFASNVVRHVSNRLVPSGKRACIKLKNIFVNNGKIFARELLRQFFRQFGVKNRYQLVAKLLRKMVSEDEIEKAIEVILESSITEDLKNNDGIKDINIPITIMIGSVNLGNGENPKPDGIISPRKTGAAIEYIRKFFFKDLDLKGISQLVKDTSNGVLEGAKQKDYDTVKSKIDKLN